MNAYEAGEAVALDAPKGVLGSNSSLAMAVGLRRAPER